MSLQAATPVQSQVVMSAQPVTQAQNASAAQQRQGFVPRPVAMTPVSETKTPVAMTPANATAADVTNSMFAQLDTIEKEIERFERCQEGSAFKNMARKQYEKEAANAMSLDEALDELTEATYPSALKRMNVLAQQLTGTPGTQYSPFTRPLPL